MSRILVAAVLLAFMPTANAADAKKADFSTNAEFRARYMFEQNQAGNEDTMPATKNTIGQRLKMGVNYRASEKASAVLTLIHGTNWGENTNATPSTNAATNVLLVNEAYANWMAADDIHLRIGRQNFSFGDGNVMSVNDWELTPYSFEGVSGSYDMDMGSVKAFGFKVAELTDTNTPPNNVGGDPERNLFGLSFDLKSMPEVLKMVNVHVIKDNAATQKNAAGTADSTNGVLGRDFLRYGFVVAGGMSAFDFKATYEKVTGDYLAATTHTTSKADGDSDMMQVDLGYSMESMMKSRFGFVWHKDSGDDGTGTHDNDYDGFFYEEHSTAGLMDLVNYGNLTFMGVTADMMPMDSTKVGLAYYMFSKTEELGQPTAGDNGANLMTGTATDKDELGSEIDLYAEHSYDSGLSTMARIGYFMPGDALDNATTDKGDKVMQVFLQAKMTF